MKKYLKHLPQEIQYLITLVKKVSKETKMPAYLVGGFPRDLILGLKDYDLDIAVEGNGIRFAENLAKRLGVGLIRHAKFGTATLILNHRLKVDIATTRKELYPFNASLPVVRPGSLEEDLMRRDFTINAMALSLSGKAGQKLIDIFGSRKDLVAGKIRILHDLSFKDDPTRILRAIRFQQRYHFKIDSKTLRLLKEAINLGLLNKVNPHRMRDELVLMLKENNPLGQLKQLCALGGLSFISRKLKPANLASDLFKTINKEAYWFAQNLPAYKHLDTWLIYFAALLKPLPLTEIKKIIRTLALAKDAEKIIIGCCQINQRYFRCLKNRRVKPIRVFTLLKPLSCEEIIFLRSISHSRNLKQHILDFLKIYNRLRLYISGDDLRNLGVLPGVKYKKIFAKVLAARLNGKVRNRQEELDLVRKIAKV